MRVTFLCLVFVAGLVATTQAVDVDVFSKLFAQSNSILDKEKALATANTCKCCFNPHYLL